MARSHAGLTHIASPRKPTVCFFGGWQRHLPFIVMRNKNLNLLEIKNIKN
jgi:hypothetical protein